jgi:protein phosphatase-4 regulatory subunit 3
LQRYQSRLLNLWIVKFYKAIIRVKDEAFVSYLTKKNLLKTIADIFIENPNKGNLLHSCILELFDYLSKEKVNKIGQHFVQFYSETLLKNPLYAKYFKNFVEQYEGGRLGATLTKTLSADDPVMAR